MANAGVASAADHAVGIREKFRVHLGQHVADLPELVSACRVTARPYHDNTRPSTTRSRTVRSNALSPRSRCLRQVTSIVPGSARSDS